MVGIGTLVDGIRVPCSDFEPGLQAGTCPTSKIVTRCLTRKANARLFVDLHGLHHGLVEAARLETWLETAVGTIGHSGATPTRQVEGDGIRDALLRMLGAQVQPWPSPSPRHRPCPRTQ